MEMMMQMMDGVLGSMCRETIPGLAEMEASYVSLGKTQEDFFTAVDKCNTEGVQECLRKGGVEVGARNRNGWTALHLASLKSAKAIVQILLDAKAPVDARSKPFEETPLHIAVLHGRVEVVRLLLEKGASPFSLDWRGRSVISGAQNERGMTDETKMREVRKLLDEKTSQAKPLEQTQKRTDGCGACGKRDVKLKQCARCHVQYYCSAECQKQDWKVHKPRCSQAKAVFEAIAVMGDLSAVVSARLAASSQLGAQKELIKKMKCLKAIIDIVPRDKEAVDGPPFHTIRFLPSLWALMAILYEERVVNGENMRGLWEAKDSFEQFIDAGGVETVVQRMLQGDLSFDVRRQGFMLAATPFGNTPCGPTLARRFLARGGGAKLVELLAPALTLDKASRTQASVITARLVMEEGHMLRKEKPAGSDIALGPVSEAMFRTTNLRLIANAALSDTVFGEGGANQGALTFFTAITRNRKEVLSHLIENHRDIALIVIDAYAQALFYPGEGAWSTALEFLAKALLHCPGFAGGIFSDVMLTKEPKLNDPDPDLLGDTRYGFCHKVIEKLDTCTYKETSELCDMPDPRGGILRNWENAANICLELVRHCPLLHKHWNVPLISDLREESTNPVVKKLLREAERLLETSQEPGHKPRRSRKKR